MSLQRNYYEVLGIPPGATTDQIKKKYRELARKFHPDVVQDKALGQRVFTQINQAYHVLADPQRRAQYNSTLSDSTLRNGTNGTSQNGTATGSVVEAAAAPPPPPAPPLTAQKRQTVLEFLGNADNAIMAGKPIDARVLCMKVLELDPRNVRAMELLGDALVQLGRREEGAVQYRNVLQITPGKMIQAKLNRATQASVSTRTVPPQNTNGGPRTVPPTVNNTPPTVNNTPPKANSTPPKASNTPPTKATVAPQTVAPKTAAPLPPKPNEADIEKPSGLFGRILGRK